MNLKGAQNTTITAFLLEIESSLNSTLAVNVLFGV